MHHAAQEGLGLAFGPAIEPSGESGRQEAMKRRSRSASSAPARTMCAFAPIVAGPVAESLPGRYVRRGGGNGDPGSLSQVALTGGQIARTALPRGLPRPAADRDNETDWL